jgi:superfamily II DNA or RNA helicase
VSETLNLRKYQEEAIEEVFKAWYSGMQSPAVVLPTGMGKTVIFSYLIAQFLKKHKQKAVVLVHRDELADQAIDKIRSVAPNLSVGKVKAESNETDAQVLVCSVQTVSRPKRLEELRSLGIGLVIVDECHHAAAETYKTVLQTLVWSKNVSEAVCVGFTATLARGDKVGLGEVWNDVVYSRSITYAISKGFLTDVKGKSVALSGLDLNSVRKNRGDYADGALGQALEDSDMSEALPKAYLEHAADRPGVVFTPTVATAVQVCESFNASGIRSAVISGETPREERQKIYEAYRKGRTQVLVNCMVLTEGFDAPWASCAVIARPTQSQPLFVQMVGRVLRPWPTKTDALVLDVVGASETNKLCSLIDLVPGQIEQIEEGETLTEAILREEKEPKSVLKELKLKDADLFAGSSQSWLMTEQGVMFIPLGSEGEVFLWPTDRGTFDVCYSPKNGRWQKVRLDLAMGSAQAWAETEAEERMPFNTGRKASWRKGKPSEAQLSIAEAHKITVPEDLSRGKLSDLISVKFASRKFDRYLKGR